MNKTNTAITIAMIAIVTMTGFAAAVTTDVTYTGDGSYDMNFYGTGTGYCGVHTYTDNGEDHLQTTWENTIAHGWQSMDTSEYSNGPNTTPWWIFGSSTYADSESSTDIARSVTVGGANDGANASGSILTFTSDGNNNTLFTVATYRDDVAWTSHVTTDQDVSVYQNQNNGSSDWLFGFHHDEYESSSTGVRADTEISGFAYGADTLVTGRVRSDSGDAYTVALVEMTEGEFDLNVYSDAHTEEYSESGWNWWGWMPYSDSDEYTETDGSFDMDADGIGIFVLGAGVDEFGGYANMYDDNGDLYINFGAYDGYATVQAVTQINGSLWGDGYIYAVDLT